MADNLKWFKVWTSALIDFLDISKEDIGHWTLLSCLVALKGSNGRLVITQDALSNVLRCNKSETKDVLERLAKLNITYTINDNANDNASFVIAFKNWRKYQKDSTGYERLKRWRERKMITQVITPNDNANDNGVDKIRKDKIRKDKIRKDKNKIYSNDEFLTKLKENPAFKGIDFEKQFALMDAWLLLPQNKGRKKTHRFILNWLSRAEREVVTTNVPKEENKNDMLKVMREYNNAQQS